MKKLVKYRTKDFGLLGDNIIIEVYKIFSDNDSGISLLFCPKDKNGCGCIFLAKKDNDNVYSDIPGKTWINLSPKEHKILNKILQLRIK